MLAPLALLLAGSASALTVVTPASLIQCQPILLQWSEGPPPYFVSVIPGGQASGNALKDFGKMDGTSLTWVVDLPPIDVTIKVVDATGATQFSSQVTIQEGTDQSCLNATSTSTTGGSKTDAPSSTTTGDSKTDDHTGHDGHDGLTTGTTTATGNGTTTTTKPTGNSTTTAKAAATSKESSGRAVIAGSATALLAAAAAFALF